MRLYSRDSGDPLVISLYVRASVYEKDGCKQFMSYRDHPFIPLMDGRKKLTPQCLMIFSLDQTFENMLQNNFLMDRARRVVITGLGVWTSVGAGREQFWNNLFNKHSGISATTDDYSFIPCRVAGVINKETVQSHLNEVKSHLADHGVNVDWRSISRAAAFGVCVAHEALSQSGWNPSNATGLSSSVSERAGVHFGSGMEGVHEVMQTAEAIRARQYRGVSPHSLTRTLANMAAGEISRIWGLRGPCMTTCTACATGLHSIGDAYRMIQYGEADLMVAGACEATVLPWTMSAFSRIRALSTNFNSEPENSSRPFDSKRDGFVMSEGAAAVVLQAWPPSVELSKRCGNNVQPIAEIIGYGRSGDASSLVSPEQSGGGSYRSMHAALKEASVSSITSICHINCHATSTPVGDTVELAAIARLMANSDSYPQSDSPRTVINSIKGYTGHSLGAAGAVEVVYTALAVNRGLAVANRNLHTPIGLDELAKNLSTNPTLTPHFIDTALQRMECQTELPRHESPPLALKTDSTTRRIALTNSFGFGGTNGTLVLAEWRD